MVLLQSDVSCVLLSYSLGAEGLDFDFALGRLRQARFDTLIRLVSEVSSDGEVTWLSAESLSIALAFFRCLRQCMAGFF